MRRLVLTLALFLVPATLAMATVALPGRWAATWAALAYTVIALIGYAILAGSGWRAPAFPPLIVASTLFSARLRVSYREARAKLATLNAFLAENLLGMKVVHLFNREKLHHERVGPVVRRLEPEHLDDVLVR